MFIAAAMTCREWRAPAVVEKAVGPQDGETNGPTNRGTARTVPLQTSGEAIS